ncbi:hypothetical protein HDK77DRAFT_431100 [Phyllosticta capitalensis]
MTPLYASSPTSINSNASANAASPISLDPSDPQITLWTRLWPCTRSQAISRIAATQQIMMLRSSDKAAAKDRKWDQVKHTWERQGIGRLEWEHLEMVGGFGGHDDVEGLKERGLGLSVRGAGREDDCCQGHEKDHDGVGSRRRGAGDVSPISPSTSTSTSTSGSTNASPTTVISPPPPPPSSPSSLQSQNSPSTSFRHSNQSSTAADEEIFQATLSIVDAHGVDRGAAVARAVWIVLRDHLECVRLGAECAVACLVCRLIRAKFERIREEFGGYAGHEGRRGRGEGAERDWSTAANASNMESLAHSNEEYVIGNGISAADASAAQSRQLGVELHPGPHELDASETCSKRSTIDDASILSRAALVAAAEQSTGNISSTSTRAVVFAPPRCVNITSGYQSYQYQPAPPSRAIVFDPSLQAPGHGARTRVGRGVTVSARSRSEPCLSNHPIYGHGRGDAPLYGTSPAHSPSPSPSSRGHVNVSACSSSSSTATGAGNGGSTNNKKSPLRALARFVGDKSKQLLPATLPVSISLPRPFPRSAPVSPMSPPPPPPHPIPANNMAPSARGATFRRRSSFALPFSPRPDGRFASFSPLCSPRTVEAATAPDMLLRDQLLERGRQGDRDGQGERARAWSGVLGSSSAARRWARRSAGRLVGGGGGAGGGGEGSTRKKSWRSAGDDANASAEKDGEGFWGKAGLDAGGGKDKQEAQRRHQHHRSWPRRRRSGSASGSSQFSPTATTSSNLSPSSAVPAGFDFGLDASTAPCPSPSPAPYTHHPPPVATASASATYPQSHPRNPPPTPHIAPVSPSAFSPASTDPPRLSLCLSLAPLPDPSLQTAADAQGVVMPPLPPSRMM